MKVLEPQKVACRTIHKKAIESDFPIAEVSQLAEKESWRKELNRPIYHIHKWWAKRLGSVFRAITLAALTPENSNDWQNFYKHQNFKGKIVLDPFMGSGTTLGEALKLGCKVIGGDINPISTFLVRQALTRVDENDLREAFAQLEEKVAKEIQHYYQTRDPDTHELIPVLYYFWVKKVITPELETIPLFSSYVFSKDAYPNRKPKAQIICPICWNITEDRFDTTQLMCSHCHTSFNPQEGSAKGQYVIAQSGKRYKIKELIKAQDITPEHHMYAMFALRANGDKIYLPVREEDEALFSDATKQLTSESLPLPTMPIRSGHNTDQARAYNYLQWRDFFNDRQLLCLGLLLRSILEIEDKVIQEQFICLFSSTLEFNNLFCSFKGEGTGAVRHLFSHHILKPERTPLENSVWGIGKGSGTFTKLFESRLIPAKRYLKDPFEIAIEIKSIGKNTNNRKVVVSHPIDINLVDSWEEFTKKKDASLVINGSSGNLPIPDDAVDLVITDPPYFDFIHYSELSDFFFAWLSPVLKDRYSYFKTDDSSRPGEVQHENASIFSQQLSLVFTECHRVLVENGLLIFSFHHSRPEGWIAIYEAIKTSGFQVVAAHPVYAEMKVSSPKTSAKDPISIDAILVCRKAGVELIPYVDLFPEKYNIKKLESIIKSGGITLSKMDRFVIWASQLLVKASNQSMSVEEVKILLEKYSISS